MGSADGLASYPSLEQRHVLVTGGAEGIGAALVRAFCRQGARISFLDINAAAGQALCEALVEERGRVHFVRCDLTDTKALQRAIDTVMAAYGTVRVLINNAANDERRPWRDVTEQDWDRLMSVNLKHQFFATQAVAAAMAQAGGGSIINMGSIIWKLGHGGLPCYATAKAAIEGLTRSFARDLGPLKIRVNSVLPGAIMTRRQVELWLTPETEAAVLAGQCLKRTLLPEDVAPLVLFLASDDAAACTAQSYTVDGGWS